MYTQDRNLSAVLTAVRSNHVKRRAAKRNLGGNPVHSPSVLLQPMHGSSLFIQQNGENSEQIANLNPVNVMEIIS
jgi:hypothetical protein